MRINQNLCFYRKWSTYSQLARTILSNRVATSHLWLFKVMKINKIKNSLSCTDHILSDKLSQVAPDHCFDQSRVGVFPLSQKVTTLDKGSTYLFSKGLYIYIYIYIRLWAILSLTYLSVFLQCLFKKIKTFLFQWLYENFSFARFIPQVTVCQPLL